MGNRADKATLELALQLSEFATLRAFQHSLPALLDDALKRGHLDDLLLLAQECEEREQWLGAAQIYVHVLAFYDHFDRSNVSLGASEQDAASPESEMALEVFGRLCSVLNKERLTSRQRSEWIVSALAQLFARSPEVRASAARLAERMIELAEKPSDEGSNQRMMLGTMLRQAVFLAENPRPHRSLRSATVISFGLAGVLILALGWYIRDTVKFPMVSALFGPPNLLGAALIAWPLLLVLTWVFAFSEAQRTRTEQFIHPAHLLGKQSLLSGEIMPFLRDVFYHIFQFVWLPFLVISLLLMRGHEQIIQEVQTRLAGEPDRLAGVMGYLRSIGPVALENIESWTPTPALFRALAGSDTCALIASAVLALAFMANQRRIQARRCRLRCNLYWWDYRISPAESRVRLAMVGLDTFLGGILLFKIIGIGMATSYLLTSDALGIKYFSPDGLGGIGFIFDQFKIMLGLVFIFGLFVIASIYMHWDLPEYRASDMALLVAYMFLIVVLAAPLILLEFRLESAREALLNSLMLEVKYPPAISLTDFAQQVRGLADVRSWSVSIFSFDPFKSPVLLLALQMIVVLVQYVVRAGSGRSLLGELKAKDLLLGGEH